MRRKRGARRVPEPGREAREPDTAASRGQPPISQLTDVRRGPVPVLVPAHARAVGLARALARAQMPAQVRPNRFREAPARRVPGHSKETDPSPGFGPDRARAPVFVPVPDNPRPEDQGCPVVHPGHGAPRGPLIDLRVDRPGRRQNHSGLARPRTGRSTTGSPGHNTDRGRQETEEGIRDRAAVGLETIDAAVRLTIRAADDAQRQEHGPELGPAPAGRGISRGPTATLQSRPPNS